VGDPRQVSNRLPQVQGNCIVGRRTRHAVGGADELNTTTLLSEPHGGNNTGYELIPSPNINTGLITSVKYQPKAK